MTHGSDEPRCKGAPGSAPFLVLAWAGLAGASGMALAALAAHNVQSQALATASTVLTLHATAAIAIVAAGLRLTRPCLWFGAAAIMLAAVSIFSGEIAFHAFTGNAAFQFLAPVGGALTIISWLVVAVLAIAGACVRR